MVAKVRRVAVSVDVHRPLEPVRVRVTGADVPRLQVLELAAGGGGGGGGGGQDRGADRGILF
eukprot:29414-Pelagococcus_subviridis.AAC.3